MLSAEEAQKIHVLATRITFGIADCGPEQVSNVNGVKKQSSRINGFQSVKAREIIKNHIEDFLLRGY